MNKEKGNTAQITSLPILEMPGVNVDVSKYAVLYIAYSSDFKLNRKTSPTEFISEFLESCGYKPIEKRDGQKFDHSEHYSILQSVHTRTNNPSIDVLLNMDGLSKVTFVSRTAEGLHVANDLVRLMMQTYKK